VAGNYDEQECRQFIKKYFGNIPSRPTYTQIFPAEKERTLVKTQTIENRFPENAFYYAFPCCGRKGTDFYAVDFLTDVVSEGKSSLLYSKLKKERMLFSTIDCYLTATIDPGLIIVEAKLNEHIKLDTAESAFWEIIHDVQKQVPSDHEWEKYQNKNESAYLFSQLGLVNQALNLSYAEWLGNPDLIYTELENYRNLKKEQIQEAAHSYFKKDNYCSLYYLKTD
jgi:predicted Zn-dependent peptidase